MKIPGTAALIAALLLAGAQPVAAATLNDGLSSGQKQTGAFAGARFRLKLGGSSTASAALAIAPMQRAATGDGTVRTQFGEGLALGFASRSARPALSIGGRPASVIMRAQDHKRDDDDDGVSTLGWVGIGAGVLAVAAVAGFLVLIDAVDECSDGSSSHGGC